MKLGRVPAMIPIGFYRSKFETIKQDIRNATRAMPAPKAYVIPSYDYPVPRKWDSLV